MSGDKSERPFDIVVYGATGFTGQLVCEYLAESIIGNKARGNVRVALAGRTLSKLEAVRADMTRVNEQCGALPLLVAAAGDSASLDAMARQARVVITTVGPYALYGVPLVEACVRQCTDYVDLTGETPFMRHTIATYDAVARKKGVAIVHTCGFDSIPSDIGALVAADHIRKSHAGHDVARIKAFVGPSRGGASGGTIASMLNMLKTTPTDELKAAGRADCLVPPDVQPRPRERDLRWARYDPDGERWTAPWFMEAVNTRVVRRSAALRDRRCFAYTEVLGAKSALQAYAVSIGFVLTMTLLVLPPTRWLLERFVLPAPGQGPDRDTVVNGFFGMEMLAFSDGGGADAERRRVKLSIKGKRDPGYGATSRMLTEAALCLLDRTSCDIGADGGGVLTPASAFGLSIVAGLEKAGITFEVSEDTKLDAKL